jgi:PAS domain S-box-containing protein
MAVGVRSILLRFGFAGVSVGLAAWLRLLLDPLLGNQVPYAAVFFAVLLTAWHGGFRPALAAAVLGALATTYFILPPRGGFAPGGWDQQLGLAIYGCTSLGIAVVGGAMHRACQPADRDAGPRVQALNAELAQTYEKLLAAEERTRFVIERAHDYSIFMLDTAGNVVSWNAGAERNKGYRAEEIIGRHFSCFYPEEDIARGKPEQELQQTISEGRCEDEGWRIRKDGSRFWARVVITALRDKAGRVCGFTKVTRDITEGMRAQERFSQAVESALNAMVLVDAEGKILLVNALTEKLFGYERDELLGQPVEMLVPQRFQANHPSFRNGFFASPQVRPMGIGRDLHGRRKDGSEFPVEIH